jgi:hypothetical protein
VKKVDENPRNVSRETTAKFLRADDEVSRETAAKFMKKL